MDYAFCFFSLHAEGYDWIIPEMSRVLRTDGIGIILEINAPEGDYPFLSFLLDLLPVSSTSTHTNWYSVSRIGTDINFARISDYE